MSTARKYQDKDIRSNPDLLASAVNYARYYDGEFDFLVAASELVSATGTLPVAVARGVLNCMRADPRHAFDLPAPMDEVASVTPITRRRLAPVDNPPRELALFVRMPARLKTPYGIARQNGKVIHRVHEATVEWSRRHNNYRVHSLVPLRPVALHVRWVCGSSWSSTTNPRLLHTLDGGYPLCRSGCWENQ